MPIGHWQGSQRRIPGLCAETRTGSDSAGVLLRYSSLMWNNRTALLASCSPSRRVRFAAMRICEMGSRSCATMNSCLVRFRATRHVCEFRSGKAFVELLHGTGRPYGLPMCKNSTDTLFAMLHRDLKSSCRLSQMAAFSACSTLIARKKDALASRTSKGWNLCAKHSLGVSRTAIRLGLSDTRDVFSSPRVNFNRLALLHE